MSGEGSDRDYLNEDEQRGWQNGVFSVLCWMAGFQDDLRTLEEVLKENHDWLPRRIKEEGTGALQRLAGISDRRSAQRCKYATSVGHGGPIRPSGLCLNHDEGAVNARRILHGYAWQAKRARHQWQPRLSHGKRTDGTFPSGCSAPGQCRNATCQRCSATRLCSGRTVDGHDVNICRRPRPSEALA